MEILNSNIQKQLVKKSFTINRLPQLPSFREDFKIIKTVMRSKFSEIYECQSKLDNKIYWIKRTNFYRQTRFVNNNPGEDTIYRLISKLGIQNTMKMITSWREDRN